MLTLILPLLAASVAAAEPAAAPAAQPAAPAVQAAAAKPKKICRSEGVPTGSHLSRAVRVCRTSEEWAALEDLRDLGGNTGIKANPPPPRPGPGGI